MAAESSREPLSPVPQVERSRPLHQPHDGRPRTLPSANRNRADVALVSSYPPTRCGIASYAASLRTAITAARGDSPTVVRVLQETDHDRSGADVVATLRPGDRDSMRRASSYLFRCRAVILQHEFGIYGPRAGVAAAELAEAVAAPLIVTFHTVTPDPSPAEQEILERLSMAAGRIVVLSQVAKRYLRAVPGEAKVAVIPHGTPSFLSPLRNDRLPAAEPMLFTWGLIGPGKGLEWSILATDRLRRRYPKVRYVVAGHTHPKVAEREGEAYRRSLEAMVDKLGLSDHVTLMDGYFPRPTIDRLLREATAVILPYDSTAQTSSGVLAEAIAAGVPVVATEFPQAEEMAQRGAAVTVPHRSPEHIAMEVTRLIEDRGAAEAMIEAQAKIASASTWPAVGQSYVKLLEAIQSQVPA